MPSLLVFVMFLSFNLNAQNISVRSSQVDGDIYHTGGAIGIGINTPASSSLLDIASSEKGILIPRLTSAQIMAIENPAHSLFVFNTSTSQFVFYDENALQWKAIVTSAGTCGTLLWNRDNAKEGITFLSNLNDKVGIGTDTPEASLEIKPKGDDAFRILTSENGTLANIQFADKDGSNYVGFIAPETIETNILWQLPNAKGDSGQVLTTNGVGILDWTEKEGESAWAENENTYLVNKNYKVGIGTETPQKQVHIFKNFSESKQIASFRLETFYPQGINDLQGYNSWDIENRGNTLNFNFGKSMNTNAPIMQNMLSFSSKNRRAIDLSLNGKNKSEITLNTNKDTNLASSLIISNTKGKFKIKHTFNETTTALLTYTPENNLKIMKNCFVSKDGKLKAKQLSVKNNKFLADAGGNVTAKTYKSKDFEVAQNGVVTAAKFVGDGSALTNINTGGIWTITGAQNATYNGDIIIGDGPATKDGGSESIKIMTNKEDWFIAAQEKDTKEKSGFFIGKDYNPDGIFHIKNNGNVGIGTITPTQKLNIHGVSPNIEITNTSESEAGIIFTDSFEPNIQYGKILFDSDTYDNKLNFYVQNLTPSMTLVKNGNVGIGTITPSQKLNVYGASANIEITNTDESEAGIIFTDKHDVSNQYGKILFDSDTYDNKLNFYVQNLSPSMTLVKNGNVPLLTGETDA